MAAPEKARASTQLLLAGTLLLLIGGVITYRAIGSGSRRAPPTAKPCLTAAPRSAESKAAYPRKLLQPRRLVLRDDHVQRAAMLEFGPPPLPGESASSTAAISPQAVTATPWYEGGAVVDSLPGEDASPQLVGPQSAPAVDPNIRRLPAVEEEPSDAPPPQPSEPRRLPPVVEEGPEAPVFVVPRSSESTSQTPWAPLDPPFEDGFTSSRFNPVERTPHADDLSSADHQGDDDGGWKRLPAEQSSVDNGSNRPSFPGFEGDQWTPDATFTRDIPGGQERPNQPTAAPGDRRPDPAMQAVCEQAMAAVQYGFSLAERGATCSARAQFIQALRMIAQAHDARAAGAAHSDDLAMGLRALEEAEDFMPRGSRLEADLDVAAIIEAHRTPIFKDQPAPTPLIALQRYYTFAQDKLADAAGPTPAGSMALYGLGKLYAVGSGQTPEQLRLSAPKAMALQHAALTADSRNFRAANELGVLLARYGQLQDARKVLLHGLSLHPTPSLWHNLSIVHERLGEVDLARRAKCEYELALRQAPRDPRTSLVQWVSPDVFARSTHTPVDQPVQRTNGESASRNNLPPGAMGRLWAPR
jgi:tetratricopeptide (TPR) repeat protein